MPKHTVKFTLGAPMKNPHWKQLAESVFNRPETGKRYQVRFMTEEGAGIDVLVGRIENRTGLRTYVTGVVAWGSYVPGLGHCGAQRMKFKINYDYENHAGELIITTFGD